MIFRFPRGSSVYLIFSLIDFVSVVCLSLDLAAAWPRF
jgi:hypothetical protein